jgi:hypothetical protein
LRPVEPIPRMGEGGIKENGEGSEFKYDLFDIRTFANVTMYPAQQQRHKLKNKDINKKGKKKKDSSKREFI